MDIRINDQKGGVTVLPENPPTQQEIVATAIKEENQEADKQKRADLATVEGLVRKSNRILISISTHKFPFDIFPDTLNIEEGRITIITRRFFLSARVHSVDMKDISNVFVNMAPFFAQLVIISKTFTENEIRVRYLRKDEAVLARRIIEGLRIFATNQIDTSTYGKEELVAKLKELSTTEIVT